MRRIERLYALSERLRRVAPATVPARTLAVEYGVTRRTIERDLATLKLAGAPLFGQPGRHGGSGSVANASRAVVALDHTEIAALVLAAHLAADAPYANAASSAVDKLLDVLDADRRAAVAQLRARFRIALADHGEVRPSVQGAVEDAVREQTVVRIRYTDRNGVRSSRRIEPVGFYTSGARWSVVAWCQLRDAGRLFHLDRITAAYRTNRTFPARDLDQVLGWVPLAGHQP